MLLRADVARCAGLLGVLQDGANSAQAYVQFIAGADSSEAEEYSRLIEELVWAGLRGTRMGGDLASHAEVEQAVAMAKQGLPAVDRARLARLSTATTITQGDLCFAARATYRAYSLFPKTRAGALLRAMQMQPPAGLRA